MMTSDIDGTMTTDGVVEEIGVIKDVMTTGHGDDTDLSSGHLAPGVVAMALNANGLEALDRLGSKIRELNDFLGGKTNVHKAIRDMAKALRHSFDRVMRESVDADSAVSAVAGNSKVQHSEVIAVETQTSPSLTQGCNADMARPGRAAAGASARNRDPVTPPRSGMLQRNQRQEEEPLQKKKVYQPSEPAEDSEWQESRKRKYRRLRPKPALPNALVVKKQGVMSYAQILSRMKQDPGLVELGSSVNKIRKTAAGDLILTLNRVNAEQTSQFRSRMEEVLGQEATVKSRVHELEFEIRDLDEGVTREDIRVALSQRVGDVSEMVTIDSIKSLRLAYGDTQTAVVRLPADIARKAMEVNTIRVGWVVCRIRERVRPTRCFKCWLYGHLARDCKGNADRSNHCIKCGQIGHKANACPNNASCLLCLERDVSSNSGHVAGSSKCPAYIQALQAMKQRKR